MHSSAFSSIFFSSIQFNRRAHGFSPLASASVSVNPRVLPTYNVHHSHLIYETITGERDGKLTWSASTIGRIANQPVLLLATVASTIDV